VRDAAGSGATVVFASHEADRATALAGRTVTMAGGQVRATGPTLDAADAVVNAGREAVGVA
jgi:ABC-type sulfate/molybdate transport systems ATPase subunit